MKKINIFELIVIGLGILASFFAISKFVLCQFKMQTDFLSASATLFAAVVALRMFNSWKEQYQTELFERLKDRIHHLFNQLENNYNNYYELFILNDSRPARKMIHMHASTFQNTIDQLLTELDFYEKLIKKYKEIDIELICEPSRAKTNLTNILKQLNPDYIPNAHNAWVEKIYEVLKEDEVYKLLITMKIFINDDLQKIILNLIDEQKGQ
ncbi:hypothetical protein [Acinetobacter junii]|uniref:hypothetical protein n=1 Tax=Acinetobacter junii TaxID=40215 RepID=UPI0030A9A7E5